VVTPSISAGAFWAWFAVRGNLVLLCWLLFFDDC
jgi:4-hydroxybenzoate polyprenyltransferase